MNRLFLLFIALLFNIGTAMADTDMIWIDVRSADEFNSGHLEGAINIVHTDIVNGVNNAGFAKDAHIMLYCRSGNRSGMATQDLLNAGWTNVANRGAYEELKIEFGKK